MTDTWKKLQPLRVANGWTISLNNFYDVQPTPETMTWFYASSLLRGHSLEARLAFECVYEAEGDPEGEFIVSFDSLTEPPMGGMPELDQDLGSIRTRSKDRVCEAVEYFMFERKILPD
jgi:hypothetical protein